MIRVTEMIGMTSSSFLIIVYVLLIVISISNVSNSLLVNNRLIAKQSISSSSSYKYLSSNAQICKHNVHNVCLKDNNSRRYSSMTDSPAIDANTASTSSEENSILKVANVLYKFSRPHTIKGTILASLMGVTKSLIENPNCISWSLLPRAFVGLTALLCGNAYIVGINQIYDVKIDEINKPFLPIAAKKLSINDAWKVVFTCLIVGVSIVKTQFSSIIFNLYMTGVLLGTIYSVPPIQLKRFPLFAGSIIAVVRGFLLNFGVYYAVREALRIPFKWNPVVVFISSFMTVFASIIAITKDLPDIEGDVKYNIVTLASKFGVQKIALGSTVTLSMAYVVSVLLPFLLPKAGFQMLPMTVGHSAFLIYLTNIYKRLDSTSMSSVRKFYKSIWNLFYLEYVLYVFI